MKTIFAFITLAGVALACTACTTVDTVNGPRTVLTPEGREAIRGVTNIGVSTLTGYLYNGKSGAQSAAIGSLAGNASSVLLGAVLPAANSGGYQPSYPPSSYRPSSYYPPQPAQPQPAGMQIIGYTENGYPIYRQAPQARATYGTPVSARYPDTWYLAHMGARPRGATVP